MKILDCTLRDGGYYTNWDFSDELLFIYLKAMNDIPVDYVEIGYRAFPEKAYRGRFYYCPDYLIDKIHSVLQKKIALIIDEKNCDPEKVLNLLSSLANKVDLVRITVAPEKIQQGLALAKQIKKLDFKVAFNLMYISRVKNDKGFIDQLKNIPRESVDILYLVDSFGGILPDELEEIVKTIKQGTDLALGFHGHNNMELAFANTLVAMANGVEYIDATVTGMGRGAGNLKTELMMTYLSAKGCQVGFNGLSKAVLAFEDLKRKYEWGTNLPYMVSGAFSLPQKDVMDWTTKRYYSYNGILQALMNKRLGVDDNVKLPFFTNENKEEECLILGGGNSVKEHLDALRRYIGSRQKNITIIFSSSRNARDFLELPVNKIFCMQGKEADRLENVLLGSDANGYRLIYSPFPRKMGTQVPDTLIESAYELEKWQLKYELEDSHLKLALETALLYDKKKIILAGFDGYNSEPTSIEFEIAKENDQLFGLFRQNEISVVSLTPTKYKNLEVISLYSLIN